MIVAVTGGRDFDRPDWIAHALDDILDLSPITALYHGGAKGADTLAGGCAKARGIPVVVHRANWRKHGKAAGPIRNREMLGAALDRYRGQAIILLMVFPGGRGTADCEKAAGELGIPVSHPHDPGVPHTRVEPHHAP